MMNELTAGFFVYLCAQETHIKEMKTLIFIDAYIKALSHLWRGGGELAVVAAQNMDYSSAEEIEERIKAAVAEGMEICKEF